MKRATLGLLLVLAFALAPSLALAQGNTWTVPGNYVTIQDAIDDPSVISGDKIIVASGYHAGATVTKAVEIKGEDGTVINAGPLPWASYPPPRGAYQAGFLFVGNGTGSGATISHLRFEGIEFPVFSRGADDVTVTHNVMLNPIQGITNWAGCINPGCAGNWGDRWNITHNEILDLQTACGGGIGIIVADYMGYDSYDNVVAHNKVHGTLHVAENDCGGYAGTGIVLYADFRYGRAGSAEIAWNRVVKNKVALVSDNAAVVDAWAFELTDTRDSTSAIPYPVVRNNAIGFNDFRESTNQIALTPLDLGNYNSISRNLGENRGHGLHPKLFGPGGN